MSSSVTKPRIWSLADMASKESDGPPHSSAQTLYSTAAGRLVPSLAGRLPPPGLHTAPYARPHEFYRSLYGAQHLAAGVSGGSPEASFLETYSRTLGSNLSSSNASQSTPTSITSVLTKASLAAGTSANVTAAGIPLGLATPHPSRMSPSSTSSMSSSSETTLKPVALNKA